MSKVPVVDLKYPFCNACGASLEWIKAHGGFWKCSNLDCPLSLEVWSTRTTTGIITTGDAHAALRSDIADKKLCIKHTGSKPAGRKRTKPPKFFPNRLPE